MTDEGKEKKVTIDIEPFKPINQSLYMCDNKFHTQPLSVLLEDDAKFGFIVMDGNGSLFGTLAGSTREIIHKLSVELPKKHGRGGQSALRFSRLRMEARHNYVRKIAELAVSFFIKNDKLTVNGLVLAGSADFKTVLSQSDLFDQRLATKIITIVDVSYGGEQGFNEAIELASDSLMNVKFVQEKKMIQRYFNEISHDSGTSSILTSGKYCFGIDDTFKALELGAVEFLILYENLEVNRYTLKNVQTGVEIIKILDKKGEANTENFLEDGVALETVETTTLIEWVRLWTYEFSWLRITNSMDAVLSL